MKLTRRGFIGAMVAGAASVAIGLRLAHGIDQTPWRWRSSRCGPFTYWMHLDDPRALRIYRGDDKYLRRVSIEEVNQMAWREHQALMNSLEGAPSLFPASPDQTYEHLQLAAEINMSQGMNLYRFSGASAVGDFADGVMRDAYKLPAIVVIGNEGPVTL